MLRAALGSTMAAVAAAIFGLLTTEIIILGVLAICSLCGVVALVGVIVIAGRVDEIQARQERRLDDLPPPGG